MRCELPCAMEEGTVARLVDKTEATAAWETENPPSLVLTVWVGKDGRTLNRASWAADVTDRVRAAHTIGGEVDVAATEAAIAEMTMASMSALLLADALLKAAAREDRALPCVDEAAASA